MAEDGGDGPRGRVPKSLDPDLDELAEVAADVRERRASACRVVAMRARPEPLSVAGWKGEAGRGKEARRRLCVVSLSLPRRRVILA